MPEYLGSQATFTLGQFGGHAGRNLLIGDMLPITAFTSNDINALAPEQIPTFSHEWEIAVMYGPHGAPDFFTKNDIDTFFANTFEIHFNSSRTGIRLIGPKPEWAREDGGEAGLHPSNIHDNAYAIGAIDFTGDMPIILGPDGPSLGGFVCPAVVINSELWKLGQLKAGDKVKFVPVSYHQAKLLNEKYHAQLEATDTQAATFDESFYPELSTLNNAVLDTLAGLNGAPDVVYRPAGNNYMLVEYGELVLDLNLRFRIHALMQWVQQQNIEGIIDLTPGIRSLQIHFDSIKLDQLDLLRLLQVAEAELPDVTEMQVPSRTVYLPLAWEDSQTQLATERYMQTVRPDAPWCPDNIEFIRRINGLKDKQAVKDVVYDARYLVMGLGDVYLGAPVATPLDPRQRLVTTKYNPARTWTPENAVGIGGAYMCVYGMEGPGGYQFVGRTLQMWNRYRQTAEFSQPWLLRFFDQIKFYEVDADELLRIRREFPRGRYPIQIEEIQFSLADYNKLVNEHADEILVAKERQQTAFEAERQRWIETGQANFSADGDMMIETGEEEALPDHHKAVESLVSGNVWQVLVEAGQTIKAGQPLLIIESMKMEIEVVAPHTGKVVALNREAGQQVRAGQRLLVLEE